MCYNTFDFITENQTHPFLVLFLFQILPSGEDRPESLEVQTNAEIVNETENIERMEGVEEDELLNRDEKSMSNLLFQLKTV